MKKAIINFPKQVIYGEHAIESLKNEIKGYSNIALFSYGSAHKNRGYQNVIEILEKSNEEYLEVKQIPKEPTYLQVQEVYDEINDKNIDLIIAFGGGSVIDTAKLVSVMNNDITVKDLIEDSSLAKKNIDTIVIPTTCGTGAEATPNSIVLIPEKNLKFGIVNPEMLPNTVILDSITIESLPKEIIAHTGVDALCHAIECYTSNKANDISDLFALESLKLIYENLESAYVDEDMESKQKMLLAAYYAGIAIAAAGTTAVHALSYPLGGKYRLPHGLSNAMLLMPVMIENRDAIEERLSNVYNYIINKGDEDKADLVLSWMENLLRTLNIPTSLKEFNIDEKDLDYLAESAFGVKRLLDNNMKEYDIETIKNIYTKII